MTRLLQGAALLTLAFAIGGCETNGSSKSDSKSDKKRPEQFSMITVADELAAKVRLQSIATAEAAYHAEHGNFATLEELISTNMLGDPADGKLARYRFEVRVKSDGFEATAVPENYGVTGKHSFYLDETRTLRGADKQGAKATASDPAV